MGNPMLSISLDETLIFNFLGFQPAFNKQETKRMQGRIATLGILAVQICTIKRTKNSSFFKKKFIDVKRNYYKNKFCIYRHDLNKQR